MSSVGDTDVIVTKSKSGADVFMPPMPSTVAPTAVIHFIGGTLVGSAPRAAYGPLLEGLCRLTGAVIVATPLPLATFDHLRACVEASLQFSETVREDLGMTESSVPIIGIGHSLGSKVLMLLGALPADSKERLSLITPSSNIFLAFNNYGASQSIPFYSQLRSAGQQLGGLGPYGDVLGELLGGGLQSLDDSYGGRLGRLGRSFLREMGVGGPQADNMISNLPSALANLPEEFTPDPASTWRILESSYGVERNAVIKFTRDGIDESDRLAGLLVSKMDPKGGSTDFITLPGTHTTPNDSSAQQQTGSLAVTTSAATAGQYGGPPAYDGGPYKAGASEPELEKLTWEMAGILRRFIKMNKDRREVSQGGDSTEENEENEG